MSCKHAFHLIATTTFQCQKCNMCHECSKTCEYLQYNSDQTLVCSITGQCFHQKRCELGNNAELDYIPKCKKNQQIKNSFLNSSHISEILDDDVFPICDIKIKTDLDKQIKRLWTEYVVCAKHKNLYIHRKDSISFIVGILFSLHDGMKCDNAADYIIFPHTKFSIGMLNKKKKYKNFEVSYIRYGINKIKTVFLSYIVRNKINIEEFT